MRPQEIAHQELLLRTLKKNKQVFRSLIAAIPEEKGAEIVMMLKSAVAETERAIWATPEMFDGGE